MKHKQYFFKNCKITLCVSVMVRFYRTGRCLVTVSLLKVIYFTCGKINKHVLIEICFTSLSTQKKQCMQLG